MNYTRNELSDEILPKKWTKVNRPNGFKMLLLLILPLAFTNLALTFIVLMNFNNPIKAFINDFSTNYINIKINNYQSVFLFTLIFILIIVHKLIHIIFIRNFKKTIKYFRKYNVFKNPLIIKEKITKRRYIIILLMPFGIISLLMPILFGIFNLINWVLIFLIMFNALICSTDILECYLIVIQVPSNSYIIRTKRATYYKVY